MIHRSSMILNFLPSSLLAGPGGNLHLHGHALEGKPSTYMGMELPFDLTQLAAIEVAMFAIAETARLENT
eukprot:gene1527-32903_t